MLPVALKTAPNSHIGLLYFLETPQLPGVPVLKGIYLFIYLGGEAYACLEVRGQHIDIGSLLLSRVLRLNSGGQAQLQVPSLPVGLLFPVSTSSQAQHCSKSNTVSRQTMSAGKFL